MLTKIITSKTKSLINLQYSHISFTKLILQFIRTKLNKIKWQDNRQFTQLQKPTTTIPRSPQQANELFIAKQRQQSMAQKSRMQRIDDILGTSTHFYQTKIYQKRLDSDHIMNIRMLKKNNLQPTRNQLNWMNPQIQVPVKYKSRYKYYDLLSNLKIYPKHQSAICHWQDNEDQSTINFLAKETLYTNTALKKVDLTMESMQNETVGSASDSTFSTTKNVYFRLHNLAQLYRIPKQLYNAELLKGQNLEESKATLVVCLDQIYEIMKQYYFDERVNFYLKKIQNNQLPYLMSSCNLDRDENMVAIMIDLLGDNKQFVLIVKNLRQTGKVAVLFNIKPQPLFSPDGNYLYYVQRSQQGAWIELVKHSTSALLAQNGESQSIFKCQASKELSLISTKSHHIFVSINQISNPYNSIIYFIKHNSQKDIQIQLIDQDQSARFEIQMAANGLIFSKFNKIQGQFLKYGGNKQKTQEVWLIPFKKQTMLAHTTSSLIGLSDNLQLGYDLFEKSQIELDLNDKKLLFKAESPEYIKQFEVKKSHLILVKSLQSTYNRQILQFIPFRESSKAFSIFLEANDLLLSKHHHEDQQCKFQKRNGIVSSQKLLSIWNKQMSDRCDFHQRYNVEKINISSSQEEEPLYITVMMKNLYVNESNLPVIIYFPTRNESIENIELRRILQKGVAVVQFMGRGTFTQDLQHYLQGTRSNVTKMISDLQKTIEFIGNNLTKNISLYCKGQFSSLIGLSMSLKHPWLFNAVVLHDGFYDIKDHVGFVNFQDFFGKFEKNSQWSGFDFPSFNYQKPFVKKKKIIQESVSEEGKEVPSENKPLNNDNTDITLPQLGVLQNIVFSSKNNRNHSRKMIHHLRKNPFYKYKDIFLKEHDDETEVDLFNMSYLYLKLRQRMETDINDPQTY